MNTRGDVSMVVPPVVLTHKTAHRLPLEETQTLICLCNACEVTPVVVASATPEGGTEGWGNATRISGTMCRPPAGGRASQGNLSA
eukprot:8119291-Pyramimonas_sp.AAC.1